MKMITTIISKAKVTTRALTHRDSWQRLLGHGVSRGNTDEQTLGYFFIWIIRKQYWAGKQKTDVSCQKGK